MKQQALIYRHESNARSILKAISWRVCGSIATTGIVYFYTAKFSLALTVGLFEVLAKMALYFMHERLWQRISFGFINAPAKEDKVAENLRTRSTRRPQSSPAVG